MAHAGLRREMHDLGKAMRLEQFRHSLAVGNVQLLEPEAGKCLELRNAGRFQPRIVIGVEVVEADDVIAVRQQAPRNVHADEPGRAGDENRLWHDRPFPRSRRCAGPLFALG